MTRRDLPTWALAFVVAGAVAFFVSTGSALAADSVTLRVQSSPVRYGGRVSLVGAIRPAVAGETVGVYTRAGNGWSVVGKTTTDGLGGFSLRATVTAHRVFVARAVDAVGNPVESAPVSVLVRPRVVTFLRGSRGIAEHLFVVGRVRPRVAGKVTLTEGDRVRNVTVGPMGHFEVDLTTTRLWRYRATVRLRPASGYLGWHRTFSVRVRVRPLAIGSKGRSVGSLENSLYRLHHFALPGVDNVYDAATADAVLAFQKVHGLPLTGSVDRRFWQSSALGTTPAHVEDQVVARSRQAVDLMSSFIAA